MRRVLVTAAVAAVLSIEPGAAQAANSGARLTTVAPGPTHTFTLAAARHVVWHYEHTVEGFPVTMGACGWVQVHVAECALRLTSTAVDGEPAGTLILLDRVSRAGPCYGHVTRPLRGKQLGIGHGAYTHPCFDGPLVDERGPTILT